MDFTKKKTRSCHGRCGKNSTTRTHEEEEEEAEQEHRVWNRSASSGGVTKITRKGVGEAASRGVKKQHSLAKVGIDSGKERAAPDFMALPKLDSRKTQGEEGEREH